MPSSSHDHVTRPFSTPRQSTSPLSSQIADENTPKGVAETAQPAGSVTSAPPTTEPLTFLPMPTITRPLSLNGPSTTTRLPTVIPATEKRPRLTTAAPPRRRRRITLLTALMSCFIVAIVLILFIAPLDNGQQQKQSIAQTLSSFITTGNAFNAFNPSQQNATPTATPAVLTNEGYCGGTDIWGTCATAVTTSGVMGTGTMQKPIQGAVITQPFAHPEYQTWCGCIRPHSGIDLAAPYGTPITAADSGQVLWVGWDWSGLGWAVKINHGHYIATIYGHMDHFVVKAGQNVTQGQVIGYEGSTGASTGPHLHFMVLVNNIWVDPTLYVPLP